jgi:hypothetical protein
MGQVLAPVLKTTLLLPLDQFEAPFPASVVNEPAVAPVIVLRIVRDAIAPLV